MLSGVLTPSHYAAIGFVGVWVIYAIACVVFEVVVAVVVKDPGKALEGATEGDAPEVEKVSYGELVKPNILLFYFAFLVFNMTLLAVLGFTPTFMQQQGVDPTLSGFISTLPMLLAVISSPLFGTLSGKVGRCKPFYLAALLVMGPCTLILLTQTGPLMWVGAIVMGLVGLGGPVMCLTSYINVLSRPELMSIGMGVLMLVQSLGHFFGYVACSHAARSRHVRMDVHRNGDVCHQVRGNRRACILQVQVGVRQIGGCRFHDGR